MNVKTGDLAIQIKSLCGNEGKICKVLRYLGEIEYMGGFKAISWDVEYPRPVKNTIGMLVKSCPIPDSHLRPISGLPDDEEIKEENNIREPA
jgi:hypothetical protein